MDKHIVVRAFKGILLSKKKEWSTDIHYNMKETQNMLNEKSQKEKEYTLYNSFWVKL